MDKSKCHPKCNVSRTSIKEVAPLEDAGGHRGPKIEGRHPRMNLIFFIPDELRAESVGCYGHPEAPTPNLDKLANQGVRFDQCHVQNPLCTPSRCSFMTGLYPHNRGHRGIWHSLHADEPNLLRYIKRAGYDVHWWGKNDLIRPELFEDCVTTADAVGGPTFGKRAWSREDPRYFSFLRDQFEEAPEVHSDYRRVHMAVDFLRNRPSAAKPFFLFLPLVLPHPPYSAPQPWHDMIDPGSLPPLRPPDLDDRPSFFRLMREFRRLDELDDKIFRKINAVYLGMTGFIDKLVGDMMAALDETGLAEQTAFFFFSDHGDYAGDYGLVEKYVGGLEDVLTRVPLIVRMPGGASGHTVVEPIEMFDVMPTVLELAGSEAQHTHFARSLVPQLHGEAGDPDRAVFSEGGFGLHELFVGGTSEVIQPYLKFDSDYRHHFELYQEHPETAERCVMMRTMTYKLVYRTKGQREFYDLISDPREVKNVYGESDCQEIQRELEKRLLDWYVSTSDVSPWEPDPRYTAKWPPGT